MRRGSLLNVLMGTACLAGLIFQTANAWNTDPLTPPKKLTLAVLDTYYPLSYVSKETGERMGFDFEIAKGICEQMKTHCKIIPLKFNDILVKLKNKEIDVAVAGLSTTPERREYLSFSESYFRTRPIFITNDPKIGSIERTDPKRLHVGVLRNSTQYHRLVRDFAGKGLDIRTFESNADVLKALQNHEINLWLLDGISAYSLLRAPGGRNLYIAGNYPYIDPSLVGHKIAVNRENSSLLIFIDEALLQLHSNGRIQELTLKYFPSVNF